LRRAKGSLPSAPGMPPSGIAETSLKAFWKLAPCSRKPVVRRSRPRADIGTGKLRQEAAELRKWQDRRPGRPYLVADVDGGHVVAGGALGVDLGARLQHRQHLLQPAQQTGQHGLETSTEIRCS
jgi:hypothetical protein